MEPKQFRNMWLTSFDKLRTEPEFQPLRYLGAVLEELRACESNLRDYDYEPTKERVKKLILAHIDHKEAPVRRARFERLRTACENRGYHCIIKIIEEDDE